MSKLKKYQDVLSVWHINYFFNKVKDTYKLHTIVSQILID